MKRPVQHETDAAGLRSAGERLSNFVERQAALLERLHPKQLIEVLATVVIPPADAERRRQKAFLNVVADRASGDAAEVRQIPNCEAGVLGHGDSYTTVTVALSTVAF